ncbi:hypothetical protein F0562_012670 [Nyssa sinensis]|uniref:Uncharacterized protein n=1 Tax=Nyssa sinensis TaxID=561372 RepID=A0A5J4ZW47_9ASTE|nr:hypothetical protein F0562_012670 [Nyssa sinensis]
MLMSKEQHFMWWIFGDGLRIGCTGHTFKLCPGRVNVADCCEVIAGIFIDWLLHFLLMAIGSGAMLMVLMIDAWFGSCVASASISKEQQRLDLQVNGPKAGTYMSTLK